MNARAFRAVFRLSTGHTVRLDVDLGFSRWRQDVAVRIPRWVAVERFVDQLVAGALVDYLPGAAVPIAAYSAPPFAYPATVLRVVDGDTFTANLDVGLGEVWRDQPVRLAGVNLIEARDPGGPESAANTAAELARGGPGALMLHTMKPDKYAPRIDAAVRLPNGVDLADQLVGTGWAVRWNGKGPRPVPAWPIRPPA